MSAYKSVKGVGRSGRSERRDVVTLAIDIGGTRLKATVLDREGAILAEPVRINTPDPAPPEAIVDALVALVKVLPPFDRISIDSPEWCAADAC